MTQPEVRSVLGGPLSVVRDFTELGPFTRYRYRRLDVTFFRHARATGIFTTRTAERTRAGVGMGSTEAGVRAGVPGVSSADRRGSGCARRVTRPREEPASRRSTSVPAG